MKFNKNKIFFQLTFSKLVLILVGILVITSSFAQTTHAAGDIDLHTLTVSAATGDTENIGTDKIKIELEWDGDGGPYDVFEGIVLVADNVLGSSVTLDNLDKGVEHCYTVQYDDDDPVSNEFCSHVQPEIVSLSLTGANQVTITWTQDPANNPSGTPNGYLVERVVSPGQTKEVCSGGNLACGGTFQQVTPSTGSTGLSHIDNTVVTGTEYCYEIQADWSSPRSDMDSDKACIIIDNTPPTIDGTSTPDGSNGWHKTSPAVTSWTCTDEIGGSGVDATSFEAVQSQVADTNSQDFTQTCKDNAGNESVSDTVNVKLDTQKPTIDGTSTPDGSNGWHKTSPAVTNWICNDPLLPGSGVDATSFDATQNQVADTNSQDFTQTCKDNAGNESVSDTVNVKLDTISPSLNVAAADVTFAAFETTGQATVTFATSSFTDLGSGVDPAYPISTPSSPALLSVGLHDIIHTAKDIAGNEATDTSTANVFDISFDGTPPFAVETALYLTIRDEGASLSADSVSFTGQSAQGDSTAMTGISVSASETTSTSGTFRNAVDSFFITQSASNGGTGRLNIGNSGYDIISVTYTSAEESKTITANSNIPGGAGAPATATDPLVWSSDTFQIDSSGTPKVFDSACVANGVITTVTVQVFSSADSTLRGLTLTEDSADSCTFRSTPAIVFSTADSNFNDGVIAAPAGPKILKVASGGTVTARYAANPDKTANIIINAALSGAVSFYNSNTNCGAGNDVDNDGLCASAVQPDSVVRSTNWEINSGAAAGRGLKVLRADSGISYIYGCRPQIDDSAGNPANTPYSAHSASPPAPPGSGFPVTTNGCPNPLKKDAYIEIDYMVGHKPSRDVLASVIQAFANADVTNPDGSTGITLHIQLDENLGFHYDSIPYAPTAAADFDFYEIKNAKFGKASERTQPNLSQYLTSKRQAFHYTVFAHNYAELLGSSGHGEINGNDFIITLGSFSGNTGTTADQARTLMHEFGHNLNLNHGGGPTDNINCKPNYISIMNYAFQNDPFGIGNPIDFSRSALPTLDENHLNEINGLGQATPTSLKSVFAKNGISGAANRVVTGILSSPANPQDWNGVGGAVSTDVAVAIRNMGTPCPNVGLSATPLVGYDDWANAVLNFRNSGEFSDGVFTSFSSLSEEAGTANFLGDGDHLDPVVTSITAPTAAFGKGVTKPFSATFVDPDGLEADEASAETYTATWNWGDGTTSPAGSITITNTPDSTDNTQEGTIPSPGHSYSKAGKYEVKVTITDNNGNSDTSTFPLWIMVFDTKTLSSAGAALAKMPSPVGAYKADTSLGGTAYFGVVMSYLKQKPVGAVAWELKNPNNNSVLKLTSKSFDWFIAGGPDKNEAYVKGTAKLVKGGVSSDVGFIASMVDVDKKKLTEPGYFRLKIYELGSGNEYDNLKIIYDNECLDTSPTPESPCVRNYEKVSVSQKTTTGSIIVLVK